MGLLDKLRVQATEVAGQVVEKTQETARVGQLQLQLRTLRSEEREAFADFGREAYRLHGEGSLGDGSAELTALAAKIADVRARLAEKETEVAAARGDDSAPAPDGTVEVDPDSVAEVPDDAAGGETSFGERGGAGADPQAAGTGETAAGDETSFGQRVDPESRP